MKSYVGGVIGNMQLKRFAGIVVVVEKQLPPKLNRCCYYCFAVADRRNFGRRWEGAWGFRWRRFYRDDHKGEKCIHEDWRRHCIEGKNHRDQAHGVANSHKTLTLSRPHWHEKQEKLSTLIICITSIMAIPSLSIRVDEQIDEKRMTTSSIPFQCVHMIPVLISQSKQYINLIRYSLT